MLGRKEAHMINIAQIDAEIRACRDALEDAHQSDTMRLEGWEVAKRLTSLHIRLRPLLVAAETTGRAA